MSRLYRNHGRYHGETIDLPAVLDDCSAAAARNGLVVEHLPLPNGERLIAMSRPVEIGGNGPRIYLSAGIHGDEPAGVLAIRTLIQALSWSENAGLWICPCLNPAGFALNQREGRLGTDLNRDYQHLKTGEVRAHVNWLERQPRFDLCLCLHEDWESSGFYLYELNPDHARSAADEVVAEVRKVCPIDKSPVIDGRPAESGIIRPSSDVTLRRDWPEALYLIRHKTRLSYTFEAPSDFPLSMRVKALVTAVKAAVRFHLRNSAAA